MSFAYPWLLAALVVPLIPWLWRKRRPRETMPLSTLHYLADDPDPRPARLRLARDLLRTLALMALIVALARPQGPGRLVETRHYGIDLMLALDTSGSMRARDFEPSNRLEAAKKVLKDFIARNADNRLGLVAFAGRSLTICPLTTDTPMLAHLVDRVGFDSVGQDGTAIGDGIGNCLYRLEDRSAKSRVIVLLSDGKNNSGYLQPSDAAAMAARRGVRIYTIAVGKPGGAPIPLVDAFGREVFVRNRDGSLYLPPIDEAALSQIAAITNGRYFRATDTASLQAAYAEIARLERSELPTEKKRLPSDDYAGWALAALVALVLELGLSAGALNILGAHRRPEAEHVG